MSRIFDFYATQVRILWEWRGGWWALTKRFVITLLVSTIFHCILAASSAGVDVVARRRRDRGHRRISSMRSSDPSCSCSSRPARWC